MAVHQFLNLSSPHIIGKNKYEKLLAEQGFINIKMTSVEVADKYGRELFYRIEACENTQFNRRYIGCAKSEDSAYKDFLQDYHLNKDIFHPSDFTDNPRIS